jgi:hypothetical protein
VGLPRNGKTLVLLAVVVGMVLWSLAADAASGGRAGGGRGGGGARGGGGPYAPNLTATPSHSPTPTYTTTAHVHSPTPTRTPAPVIYGITPPSGPASGGAPASVAGAFFLPGASATLGGVLVESVVVDAQRIDLTAPPLPAASLNDLVVTNPDGQSRSWPEAWFADFLDVPRSNPFHDDVETLFRGRATAGCGGGNYCPDATVTRAQIAVFLVKGGAGYYVPPPCSSTVFADVPCPGGINVDWVNELASYGVTAGCGGGNYCPLDLVTRAQMAVFLLKRAHAPGYEPPACSSTVFADVPCPGGAYVDWINELAAEGVSAGCGGGLYCPDAVLRRGQMATLLVKAFYMP